MTQQLRFINEKIQDSVFSFMKTHVFCYFRGMSVMNFIYVMRIFKTANLIISKMLSCKMWTQITTLHMLLFGLLSYRDLLLAAFFHSLSDMISLNSLSLMSACSMIRTLDISFVIFVI